MNTERYRRRRRNVEETSTDGFKRYGWIILLVLIVLAIGGWVMFRRYRTKKGYEDQLMGYMKSFETSDYQPTKHYYSRF